ncbi:competence protein ComA [Burkholderia guangdongensis]|uniref:competence protein ComA n=1 Tax=Burkholderia guangdongensis TaxID=1792500 RepID=UPI0015CCE2D2|nr:competence protein ComA [Burkholderia guangdongensis]
MTGRWAAQFVQCVQFARGRRTATGIDVGAGEVRVVVLSRVGRRADVRLDGLEIEPLGDTNGREGGRWDAVGPALAAAASRLAARGVRCDARGVMGLGDDELRTARLDLAGRDDVAEAARQAAERVSGLAPDALAFDWRHDGHDGCRGGRPGEVAIAVASQRHLQRRIDAAALAGVDLTAVDGESIAALRALRYAALHELDADEPYFAIWFGDEGVRGWWLEHGAGGSPAGSQAAFQAAFQAHSQAASQASLQFDFPDRAHAALADALRTFAQRPAGCAFVAGDVRCLARFGVSLADVGDLLGAVALPFESVHWAGDARAAAHADLHSPSFAVAFGLALKGVWA